MLKELWNGRFDSNEEVDLRLWQKVRSFEKKSQLEKSICFIGYDTDDGVVRNLGRKGAEGGSNAIRSAIQSFPVVEGLEVYDYGNLTNKVLEEAQREYSEKIFNVLSNNYLSIGLGGGHDIVFGTYQGIRKAYPNKKIGIINFDTHLDIRPYENGATSGTSFKQILDIDENVKYAIIGFKKQGNTKRLLNTANNYNVLILDEETEKQDIINKVLEYMEEVEILYVTFCMDVFDISYAPGVSAPTVMGLEPKKARDILREIIKTEKIKCLDFAEVNPIYDIDNRTARLAGALIYDVMLNIKK